MTKSDRRIEPRFPVKSPIRMIVPGVFPHSLECTMIDISATGMRLLAAENLNSCDIVAIEVDHRLLLAEIRHCAPRGDKFAAGVRRLHEVDKNEQLSDSEACVTQMVRDLRGHITAHGQKNSDQLAMSALERIVERGGAPEPAPIVEIRALARDVAAERVPEDKIRANSVCAEPVWEEPVYPEPAHVDDIPQVPEFEHYSDVREWCGPVEALDCGGQDHERIEKRIAFREPAVAEDPLQVNVRWRNREPESSEPTRQEEPSLEDANVAPALLVVAMVLVIVVLVSFVQALQQRPAAAAMRTTPAQQAPVKAGPASVGSH